MKILKRGKNPEDKTYTGTCMRCETEVEFNRSEAKYTPDQRDGDFLTVPCPVCKNSINVAV